MVENQTENLTKINKMSF